MDCKYLIRKCNTHVGQIVSWKRSPKLNVFFQCCFQCMRKKLKHPSLFIPSHFYSTITSYNFKISKTKLMSLAKIQLLTLSI